MSYKYIIDIDSINASYLNILNIIDLLENNSFIISQTSTTISILDSITKEQYTFSKWYIRNIILKKETKLYKEINRIDLSHNIVYHKGILLAAQKHKRFLKLLNK